MKKIVIIGGGVAGLSAGIYARQNGFEADIYEKHNLLGGECTGWKRGEYVIDNCIHWLTGTKEGTGLNEVWKNVGVLGDGIGTSEEDAFFAVEWEGERLTLWKDLEKTRRELLAISPEDKEEIEKFIEHTKLATSMQVPVDKPMDMLGLIGYIKLGKSMAGMGKVMKEYGKISTEELSTRFKHPLLQRAMKEYMAKEYLAYTLIVSYATLVSGNGAIPEGGSLGIAKHMEERFRSLGGKAYTGKQVKEIVIEGKKAAGIRLADGALVQADYVIAACDTAITFGKLLPEGYMSKQMRQTYEDRACNPVSSAFQVAFAVEGEMKELSPSLMFSCEDILVGTRTEKRLGVKNYRNYGKWIAPEGHTVLQCHVSQNEEDYAYWEKLYEDREAYKACKQRTAEDILKQIVKRFPAYEGKIRILDAWTPMTYTRYCGAYKGGYMSFIVTAKTKHSNFKAGIKGLSNVFLASQWLMSPGGLPTAVAMGKFAVQHVMK